MRLVFVVVALLCAYITGNRLAHPFADGDIFWQIQLGQNVLQNHALPRALGPETFTSAGAPWVPQEWLLGIIAALAAAHNAMWLLIVLAGLALFGALMLAGLRAKRAGASTYSTLAALLFAGILMIGQFGIRAQVLAWPLLAALMLVLDLDGPAVLWAIPLIVAWANVHASVMLAIPIVWIDAGCYAYARWRDGTLRTDTGLRWRLVVSALAPFATLCTPLGIALPVYAYDLLHNPVRQYIAEWQPLTLSLLSTREILVGFLPFLALCLWAAPRLLRQRPRDFILTFVMAAWTLVAIRNKALFGIVGVTAAAIAIDQGKGWEDPLDKKKFAFVPWLAGLAGVPLVAYLGFVGPPLTPIWNPPVAAIGALSALPGEHHLLCTEYSRCSYAMLQPHVRVFIDSRADPYPIDTWNGFVGIATPLPGWEETMDHYKVDAMLVDHDTMLESDLRALPGWTEVTTDEPCCSLFVRKTKS